MSNQKIFKLLKNTGRDCYLMSNENNSEIELVLTDGTNAWNGKVHKGDLSSQSKESDLPDYAEQTCRALRGEGIDGFEYELKEDLNGSGSIQLIWKQVIEKNSIKFELGSASLERCKNPGAVIAEAFDHLIKLTSHLQQQTAELQSDRDRMAAERSAILTKLESYATLKDDTEQSLYAKFVAVLNQKKDKIRSLKEQLSRISDNTEESTEEHSSSGKKTSRETATSNQESNTDDDTSDSKHIADCTTVTSTKAAEDARRDRTFDSQSPVNVSMEDVESNDDDDELPVVAKKGKKTSEADQQKQPDASGRRLQRVPCMLSMTGTTNTSTTSSDRQRHMDKSTSGKKETQKQNATGRSTDVDDLIGDMV